MNDPPSHQEPTEKVPHPIRHLPSQVGGFEVLGLLGSGGMGEVLHARQTSLGRAVALKLLSADLANDPEFVARFDREARVAAALKHPSVVDVIDAGVDRMSGRRFIAFELVEGSDLEALLEAEGALNERRCLKLARTVCVALQHAHEHGLVHRDIKPANVLLTRAGEPKLADLGLAKRFGDRGGLTQTGVVVGTPHYMSPEQAEGVREVDIRSDLYSVGLMLYRMATAEQAFDAGNAMGTIARRLTEDCPDPREVAPHLSAGFAALVLQLTAREPSDRPDTPAGAVVAIDRVLAGVEPTASRPVGAWIAVALAVAAGLVGLSALGIEMGRRPSRDDTGVVPSGPSTSVETPDPDPDPDPDPAPDPEPAPWRCRRVATWGVGGMRHTKMVYDVAFMPGGDRVVSAGYEGWLVVWDEKTGAEVAAWEPAPGFSVAAVAPLADGRIACATDDGRVRIWNPATGAQTHAFAGHTEHARHLLLRPDTKTMLSGGLDGAVREWDPDGADGADPLRTITCAGPVDEMCLLDGPPRLVTASRGPAGGEIVVWDLQTGSPITTLPYAPSGDVGLVAFRASDGREKVLYSSDQAKSAKMLDLESGDLETAPPDSGHVRTLAVTPDGRYLLGGRVDGPVLRWRVAALGERPKPIGRHGRAWAQAFAFSDDGRRAVSGGNDFMVRVWDVVDGSELHAARAASFGGIRSIDFTADAGLAVSGGAGGARRWDVASGNEIDEPIRVNGSVMRVSISPDGSRLAMLSAFADRTSGRVQWSLGRWGLLPSVRQLELNVLKPKGELSSLTASSGGDLTVVSGLRGNASFADSSPDRRFGGLLAKKLPSVYAVAIAGDRLLVAGGRTEPRGGQVGVLLVERIDEVPDPAPAQLRAEDPLLSLGASADGRIALTGSAKGRLLLWDLDDGDSTVLAVNRAVMRGAPVAVSPGGAFGLTFVGEGRIRLFDLDAQEGVETIDLALEHDRARCIAFATDDRFAIGTVRGRILIYEIARGD